VSEEAALDDGVRRRSRAELADRVARTARLLREGLGLAPGGHAALLIGNRAEAVEGVLAAIHAGVWMTPVNWHLTPDEVAYVVRDCGARVLLTDSEHEATARAVAPPGVTVLVAGPELDAALAASRDEPMPLEGPAGGNMIYTSGTTGRPKGVQRRVPATLGAALDAQRAYARSIACDGSGPHLVTGPLYHAAPLMYAIYDHACGAPIHVLPRWTEREALAWLAEREVHHTHLVPTMFVRLLKRLSDEERAAFRAPALHTVLHGAAPIAPDVKQRMIEWWGPVLYEYWGGTEGGVTTFVDSREWLAHPGTVGRALPHFEVFAADDAGRRLPPGEEGALFARHRTTPDLFRYHGDPAKTAAAFLDPYTHTLGDVGSVDAEGWVRLADRKSHTIISGGVNIYPAEVEAALQAHPAVGDVAVFGIPDDEWGEQVKAAVELAPGHEPSPALAAELIAFARAKVAAYKVPRSIDFETALPRTPAGKLYVRRLRDRYWQGHTRRI
jgi:acyl-CoA synthetase (AMP-forming)/AMP-acid ligase II